jgi:hypothetical protein
MCLFDMTNQMKYLVHSAEREISSDTRALGYLRYETVRTLNLNQFAELINRNIRGEAPFDAMVDELIVSKHFKS